MRQELRNVFKAAENRFEDQGVVQGACHSWASSVGISASLSTSASTSSSSLHTVGTLSEATREYRNLVHPGHEVRTKLAVSAEQARIALTVLQIVHRELSR
jgi:hypothetical protein